MLNYLICEDFPGGSDGKTSACNSGDPGLIPRSGRHHPPPLEKRMATHSRTLAWRIPWTEESCRLQPTESQKVGHDWAILKKIVFHSQFLKKHDTFFKRSCQDVEKSLLNLFGNENSHYGFFFYATWLLLGNSYWHSVSIKLLGKELSRKALTSYQPQ